MPYFSFAFALYAQWLESLAKLLDPAQSFTWEAVKAEPEKTD